MAYVPFLLFILPTQTLRVAKSPTACISTQIMSTSRRLEPLPATMTRGSLGIMIRWLTILLVDLQCPRTLETCERSAANMGICCSLLNAAIALDLPDLMTANQRLSHITSRKLLTYSIWPIMDIGKIETGAAGGRNFQH